jgi:hypothetical protein
VVSNKTRHTNGCLSSLTHVLTTSVVIQGTSVSSWESSDDGYAGTDEAHREQLLKKKKQIELHGSK